MYSVSTAACSFYCVVSCHAQSVIDRLADLACLDDLLKALQLILKRDIFLPLILGIIYAGAKQWQIPRRASGCRRVFY